MNSWMMHDPWKKLGRVGKSVRGDTESARVVKNFENICTSFF